MRYVGNAARLAVLLFLTTGGRELLAQGAPVATWRDLEYARAEGVPLTLDVYPGFDEDVGGLGTLKLRGAVT